MSTADNMSTFSISYISDLEEFYKVSLMLWL
jgi:hypothetical protein